MARRYLFALCLASIALLALVAACSAPAQAPTAAPKATDAPKAAPTTAPPAAPTAAPPAAKPAAEPTKPAASAAAPQKPSGWPTKAIQAIVTYDAGGPADITMRMMAPGLEKALGTSVQVVNKPGAGGQVGYAELLRAKPDGYTIAITIQPTLATIYLDPERKAGFDRSNFAGIGLMAFDPSIITVRGDGKYKTLKDLVDDAKANPEKVKGGSAGILSDDHITGLLLEKAAGIRLSIVQFTGTAPAVTALLGDHVDAVFENAGSSLAQHKAGQLRALAILDTQKSRFMPQVPTAEEQGYKIYNSSTRGLVAPAGTPKEIVNYISYALQQTMKDPEIIQKMEAIGMEAKYMNPEQFEKFTAEIEEQAKPMMSLAR